MGQFQWQTKRIQPGQGGTNAGGGGGAPGSTFARPGQLSQNVVALNELKFTLHQRLIEELDPNKLEGLGKEKAREAVEQAARTLIAQEMPGIVGTTRDELVSAVADEVLGLGPLEPLLRDASISEVMVNAPDEVYYEPCAWKAGFAMAFARASSPCPLATTTSRSCTSYSTCGSNRASASAHKRRIAPAPWCRSGGTRSNVAMSGAQWASTASTSFARTASVIAAITARTVASSAPVLSSRVMSSLLAVSVARWGARAMPPMVRSCSHAKNRTKAGRRWVNVRAGHSGPARLTLTTVIRSR